MVKPLGSLINYPSGLDGERGTCYDYLLAANGLFIETGNKLLTVRVPLAYCTLLGLAPMETKVTMRYGRIPQHLFDRAMDEFLVDTHQERYVAVVWDNGYKIYDPEQKQSEGGVEYVMGANVILDLHSHGQTKAWFSTHDNDDERGLKLYGVVGNFGEIPEVRLRLGIYGYFYSMAWGEVFEGSLHRAVEAKDELEEIVDENDLHSGTN